MHLLSTYNICDTVCLRYKNKQVTVSTWRSWESKVDSETKIKKESSIIKECERNN